MREWIVLSITNNYNSIFHYSIGRSNMEVARQKQKREIKSLVMFTCGESSRQKSSTDLTIIYTNNESENEKSICVATGDQY